MRQPQSIRFYLTAVFLFFFLLVVVLGSFSIWRLNSFNLVSADVAEVWLPTTRALGDLNNYTSDFRAIEGANLLLPNETAATEQKMAELDRAIATAERNFEQIRHDQAENDLYSAFKARWNEYRSYVNQLVVLARDDRKDEAVRIYGNSSRTAYNAASDTLDKLTGQAVARAQVASDRLAAAYRQTFWLILLAIVIAAILVVVALITVSRSISAPLLRLADRMRRLAANDTESDIPGTERLDEIGEMAQATVVFRNNALELIRSQQMLSRQANLLEEQLAHEQRLALMQRNFVSMASHEFRTPLTVIDGHARRLNKIKDMVSRNEIGERAGKIRSAVLRMTYLIDNLLNTSLLVDSGSGPYFHHFHPAELDLTVLLQEVCKLHQEMAPASPIVERFPTEPMPMIGDAKLLFQVFSNLLANAIKYSPGGGPIEVEASGTADEVVVAVNDRGIGIPTSDLDRLFERYHRGGNVSGIVGTGMGLYLVKMAVDLHRGSVEAHSKENEGSRFIVRLPRKMPVETDASPPAQAAAAMPAI
jgi:two-component system, OmpR family, sensor kinase